MVSDFVFGLLSMLSPRMVEMEKLVKVVIVARNRFSSSKVRQRCRRLEILNQTDEEIRDGVQFIATPGDKLVNWSINFGWVSSVVLVPPT